MALSEYVDLASERVRGAVLAANDEFFAGRENLIKQAAAVFDPDAYVPTGKLMDGWETRRRREPGHDWCLVRLGLRGVVKKVVVDTAFFRGNYPAGCSLEACDVDGKTPLAALVGGEQVTWRELFPASPLLGDHANEFAIADDRPVSHLRLRIYPDGGVARLRVLGVVAPDWDALDAGFGRVDLAALECGGRVLETSDMFFGDAQHMLLPGDSTHMGDGWETRRRREAGHDWAIVQLGTAGRIGEVEIDTQHFKGNAPGWVTLEGARVASGGELAAARWSELLPQTPLLPHTLHRFASELAALPPLSHVRINIFPDGGVARLRLWGRSERAERAMLGLGGKNARGAEALAVELLRVCGSRRWAAAVAAGFPFVDGAALMAAADRAWWSLEPADWLEAFAAHPRIGESGGGAWSKGEQAGAAGAAEATRRALAEGNQAYEQRFGHIYIVCATGRSADEMLALLGARLGNEPDAELRVAAEEQRRITRLRLMKWLTE
jgi:allantoicase